MGNRSHDKLATMIWSVLTNRVLCHWKQMIDNVKSSIASLILCSVMLFGLLSTVTAYAQGVPPDINQCRRAWVLSTTQEMNFGGFALEAGTAAITMNSFGGLTTSGLVSLSSSIPTTPWVINVDNTRDAFCATYGFTLDWGRELRALKGPGPNIPLNNVLVSIPAYGLNGVTLPQAIPPSPANTLPFTITLYGDISLPGRLRSGEFSNRQILLFSQDNRLKRVRADVFATSIVPLSITETVPMDFGTLSGGPIPGTVILDTGNGRTATGDAQIMASSVGSAASFQISGEPNQFYLISYSNGILSNGNGQQMSLTTFNDNSLGTIPAASSETFQVGATINIGPNQPAGVYSTTNAGGVPYTITINYN